MAERHEHAISGLDTQGESCCPAEGTGNASAESQDFTQLAAGFKAIADPTRLRILAIVTESPESEVCVCDLPGPLGLTQPTVSHHLRVLVEAGLLHREKRGVWAYFSPVPGALQRLFGAVLQSDETGAGV
ncbi:ArsR/SmtB family transcription factor [Leucobacter sp. NPDC015123]|uniref:ArsR/SmtB family transcription factor n=1 Tax=Leucobacter sp. NPDC015123 TaxID=3364129 RepID=UPI0036F462A6